MIDKWFIVCPSILQGFIHPSWCRISSINSMNPYESILFDLFSGSFFHSPGLRPAFAEPKLFSRWVSWSRPSLMQPKWSLDTTCFMIFTGWIFLESIFVIMLNVLFREVVQICLKKGVTYNARRWRRHTGLLYPAHSCSLLKRYKKRLFWSWGGSLC